MHIAIITTALCQSGVSTSSWGNNYPVVTLSVSRVLSWETLVTDWTKSTWNAKFNSRKNKIKNTAYMTENYSLHRVFCNQVKEILEGPFLLRWINFNPSMDKFSQAQYSLGWNNISIPKLQRCNNQLIEVIHTHSPKHTYTCQTWTRTEQRPIVSWPKSFLLQVLDLMQMHPKGRLRRAILTASWFIAINVGYKL